MKYTKALVMLTALGLSAPAFAGPGGQRSQAHRGQEVQLTGTLESVRWTSAPPGATEPHVLALVRPDSGPDFLVDLGPASNLENLTMVLGEPITVIGYSKQMGEANFVADRIATSGRERFLVIQREGEGMGLRGREQPRGVDVVIGDEQPRPQPRGQDVIVGEEREQPRPRPRGQDVFIGEEPQRGQPQQQPRGMTQERRLDQPMPEIEPPTAGDFQVQGHIVELNWEQEQGAREPHLIAQVRAQDGTLSMVDLGAMRDISELRLQEGTLISAVGSYGEFNGQSVLVADAVAEIVILDRQLQN